MVRFTARRLDPRELAEAFALARCAVPEATPERWQAFVASLARAGGGTIGVAAEGALIGLAAYRPDCSLAHGPMLRVDLLAAFELHRSAPVRTALLDGLARIARERGCESTGVTLFGQARALPALVRVGAWQALGHRIDSLFLVRELVPGASEAQAQSVRAACCWLLAAPE